MITVTCPHLHFPFTVGGVHQKLTCLEPHIIHPTTLPGEPMPAGGLPFPVSTLQLICPAGTKIEVVLARYGVSPFGTCAPSVRDCMQDGPLPLRCCHMSQCTIGVRRQLLEHCRGYASYYQVIFHCKPGRQSSIFFFFFNFLLYY